MTVKTLHDAMTIVLCAQPDGTASTAIISAEIKRLRLWTRPTDGRYPEAFQIRLRARNKRYKDLFELIGDQTVRLSQRPPR